MSYQLSKISDVIPTRLPKPVAEAIRRLAKEEGCTVNDWMKQAVSLKLGNREEVKSATVN